jgi:hypothetical protein
MYAKIFAQIYDGTLCTNGPWQALVTFQQLLILADQDGTVDMTVSAISRRTTIPIEIIEAGIKELMKPDPESRTPTEDGRRIVPLTAERHWGWRIVNYLHYRQLHREVDRRQYHQQYWHKRNKSGTDSTDSTDSTPTQKTQPNQPIAYADANANINTSPAKLPTCPVDLIVRAYHEVLPELPTVRLMDDGRKKAIRDRCKWVYTTRKPDGTLRAETPEQAIAWFKNYFERARDNDFLMGRTPKVNGHQGWKCDIDYLMTTKGLKQVIEKTEVAA